MWASASSVPFPKMGIDPGAGTATSIPARSAAVRRMWFVRFSCFKVWFPDLLRGGYLPLSVAPKPAAAGQAGRGARRLGPRLGWGFA